MLRLHDRRVAAALAASAAAGLWLAAAMPIFAQEAYYWACGRHLALSYLDHPPLAPWGIALGSALWGDGPLGIRAATLVLALTTTWVGLRILDAFGANARAAQAWLALRLGIPILAGQHFFASPDGPLELFWLVSLLALWRAREGRPARAWMAFGAALGLALASKYTAAFLVPAAVLCALGDPALRGSLRRPAPWGALLVAALLFLPVVVWNARHGWASFLFQTAGRARSARFEAGGFLEALALQLGAVFPTTLGALGAAALWLGRRWRSARDPRALFLLAFGLPLPLFLALASFWIQVKVNWLVPAYGPLALGAALGWSEAGLCTARPRLARALAAVVLVLAAGTLLAPVVVFLPQVGSRHPSWTGWDEITARALELRAELRAARADGGVFLLAPDHRDAAQIAYHAWRQGGEGRAAFGAVLAQNAFGGNGRQWGLWSPAGQRLGQDAVLVVARPSRRQSLVRAVSERFDRIERAARTVVTRDGHAVQEADLYRCWGYRGPPPPERSAP